MRFLAALLLATLTGLAGCGQPNSGSYNLEDFQTRNITRFGLLHTKTLALTFDDGPSPHTPGLLNVLRDREIKATFFVLGKNAANYPTLLERMSDEGHIIANHTKTHGDLGRTDPEGALAEIRYTHGKIRRFTHGHRLYFRAPFGSWKREHAALLNAQPELRPYIGPIFWNIGGETQFDSEGEIEAAADWECWNKGRSIGTCAKGYRRETEKFEGGVILMHDITSKTVTMVTDLLDEWIREGYRFVTLDQVRALDQYETDAAI